MLAGGHWGRKGGTLYSNKSPGGGTIHRNFTTRKGKGERETKNSKRKRLVLGRGMLSSDV